MKRTFRRGLRRHACAQSVEIFRGAVSGHAVGRGSLSDISLSGAQLRSERALTAATAYRLRLHGLHGVLEIPCRVARTGRHGTPHKPSERHYGLVFLLSSNQERSLRRFIDQIPPSPPPRDYWSI